MEHEYPQVPIPRPILPAQKRELIYAMVLAAAALLFANFFINGGLNLGFTLGWFVFSFCNAGYLFLSGKKPDGYTIGLGVLSLSCYASFAYSDDGMLKLLIFMAVQWFWNLALCRLAGRTRRDAGKLSSLLDGGYAFFYLGIGRIERAFGGLTQALRSTGPFGQKTRHILTGLVIAIPALLLVVPLLISADAAFEGLMNLLPSGNSATNIATVLFALIFFTHAYTRGAALVHEPQVEKPMKPPKAPVAKLTVNTALAAVCFVYLVYIFSQAAYFVGGFARILPEEFTLAEYARRGFFEMAALCGINLSIIGFAALAARKQPIALSTRLLCLFLGLVTLFFVATASGKMLLYIDSYGLTRLRVLTQVFMLWLGLSTILVTVHLFVPKFGYMQAVSLTALALGAALLWADVDTLVANYNVDRYLSGQAESVDVWYLADLSGGAVPALERLAQQAQPELAGKARKVLEYLAEYNDNVHDDFREWNYIGSCAKEILEAYQTIE